MQKSHSRNQFALRAISAAVIAACAAPAFAFDFKTESGWEGNIKTDLSVSQSWRVEAQDKSLVSVGAAADRFGFADSNAAAAAGYNAKSNSSTLNYDRGDRYTTLFKFITELSMSKGEMGGLLRVKGWYDDALNNHDVKYGNQANGYTAGKSLSDDTFSHLNRFDGIALLDAYVYNGFEIGGKSAQIRLGRQAVNWGESIFIQGANQLSPIDLTALSRAGTQIKEALLPIWSITGNVGLNDGMSLEGFYQLKWEPTNIETCGPLNGGDGGTGHMGKCDMADPAIFTTREAYALDSYIQYVNHDKPKDGGQWGLAFRFPVESIDTEFGLYAMNLHSRIPFLSGNVGGDLRGALASSPLGATISNPGIAAYLSSVTGAPAAFFQMANTRTFWEMNGIPMTSFKNLSPILATQLSGSFGALPGGVGTLPAIMSYLGGLNQTEAFYEYPEDIKTYAVSAATTIAGWSIGSELSYSPNTPVQLAAGDFLNAVVDGTGPFGTNGVAGGFGLTATPDPVTGEPVPVNGRVFGYERTHKTQLQFNVLNTLKPMLGASNGLVLGEVGFQWSGIDNSNGHNKRYGRSFAFYAASHDSYGSTDAECDGTPLPSSAGSYRSNAGCKNDGYMTDFAWGYRLMGSLTYPNFMDTGWEFSPSVFWSHDVKGNSIDYQFLEDRKTLSLTAGFKLNNVHKVELIYTTYANDATYNVNRDHDNVSVVYNYTF